MLYKYGRKSVGDCTAKSRMLRVCISESQFADVSFSFAVDCTMFESVEKKFVQVGSQFGLMVSILKTKGLAMGIINEVDASPVEVGRNG